MTMLAAANAARSNSMRCDCEGGNADVSVRLDSRQDWVRSVRDSLSPRADRPGAQAGQSKSVPARPRPQFRRGLCGSPGPRCPLGEAARAVQRPVQSNWPWLGLGERSSCAINTAAKTTSSMLVAARNRTLSKRSRRFSASLRTSDTTPSNGRSIFRADRWLARRRVGAGWREGGQEPCARVPPRRRPAEATAGSAIRVSATRVADRSSENRPPPMPSRGRRTSPRTGAVPPNPRSSSC